MPYAGALLLSAVLIVTPQMIFLAAAAVGAACVAWAFQRRGDEFAAIVLIGIPVHLLLLATGALASPLLPLSGAWVVAVGWARRGTVAWAAVAATIFMVLGRSVSEEAAALADLARLLLLLGLASLVPLLSTRRKDAAVPPSDMEERNHSEGLKHEPEPATLLTALNILRHAIDAAEVVIWKADPDVLVAHPVARAAHSDFDAPEESLVLEGHPYAWALAEGVCVHLERGRKALPRPRAAEMLLVPLHDERTLLAFSFIGVVPPGAGEIAVEGGRHITELLRLLHARAGSRQDAARMQAVSEAVHLLPSAREIGQFVEVLAGAAYQSSASRAAAVALWDPDLNTGRIAHVRTDEGDALHIGEEFREGDSWIALSCKHGTELHFDDLSRERQPLPLLTAGERWVDSPRAVHIQPIAVDGRVLGAVALWDSSPAMIQKQDAESMRLLCSIAAPALHGVLEYEALDRRAAADPLTGLPNRGAFDGRFAAVCAHFQRYGRPFGLIIIDIDHFKTFNDSWGHEAGDRVLQHVATLIQSSIREVDMPARLGGEEFVVLLPETLLEQSLGVAERIRETLERSQMAWNGRPLGVTASLGVASCPETCLVATDALAAADAALYRSKATGRNRVSAAPPYGLADPPNGRPA